MIIYISFNTHNDITEFIITFKLRVSDKKDLDDDKEMKQWLNKWHKGAKWDNGRI